VTDPLAFFLACAAVLFVPGPTNTLLATSGAAGGFRRSLTLPAAELIGYSISIWTLALLVTPIVDASPIVSLVLRGACGAYLIWSAVHLWREGSNALTSIEPVSFQRVLATTLLNPKAALFALVIIPYLGQREFLAAAPYLLGHAAITISASITWIAIGALIGAGARSRVDAGIIRRVGASALGVFGLILSSSVLMTGAH
jgi:threonine/homoserine/homoserine lactone efflux protein